MAISNSSRSSINSPSTLGPSAMANPYTMSSIYHSPGVQSYCGPTENLSLAGHYSDMRTSASWYGTTANDPRFARNSPAWYKVLKRLANERAWKSTASRPVLECHLA
ncbi:hypothetical protein FF38_00717 [Lucilia cuprina]|uniref:Uncharacterized protein n=1 Tax=Lucilia cuprina TaxID=7375 RepID=A0A0L0BWW7_LUCCU|nr:hypothetical protein FF38_00717 [Lucilia cuprina]